MAVTDFETQPQASPLPCRNGLKTNNGGTLPPAKIDLMQPTPKDVPIEEMRRRMRDEGYVWVKGLIPREDVLDLRESYFTVMSEAGMLETGTSPRDAIFTADMEPDEAAGIGSVSGEKLDIVTEKCHQAHSAPEYLRFLKHPSLRSFVRELMDWEDEVLCNRTLLRHSVPGAKSTGLHYDKVFLREGEAEFLTAWVPIGDIAIEGGGLAYLGRSSTLGEQIENDYTNRAVAFTPEQRKSAYNVNMAAGGVISEDCVGWTNDVGKDLRWLINDYEAGDVIFHDPYAIHTATVNQSPERKIRLSTDLRFYEKGADLDTRWMQTWFPGDGL